jgi:FdrA protein
VRRSTSPLVTMSIRVQVWRSFYQDSMVLMRLAKDLQERPGVCRSAALMGTPANHQLLASAGLSHHDLAEASPVDLMLAVEAETDAAAEAVLASAKEFFDRRRRERESTGRVLPRTLESALRLRPDANLALVSVPGAYATFEAMTALRRGLHVFLFSDNVALDDEIALKRVAVSRGLLCMGPDCGTAYLNGVGLGFANVIPRGRVGCVAASGTGLQAVACRLAALGEGISHGIGVGGRDLSEPVGGAMTKVALGLLAADPATRVIVLISKPPAPPVMAEVEALIETIDKPVVVSCLGAAPRAGAPGHWAPTLEDAAARAAALARGESWSPRPFTHPAAVRAGLARAAGAGARGARVLGLFTGGTLAHEARLVLEPLLGSIAADDGGHAGNVHRIVDLGADELTQSRPHPMIDPAARSARIREAGRAPEIGVLLVDLVLGRAAHPDPARPLAAAIRDACRGAASAGRSLAVVACVVGSEGDPQGLRAQTVALEEAGVYVLPSSAQAARFAALLIKPELGRTLLAGTG